MSNHTTRAADVVFVAAALGVEIAATWLCELVAALTPAMTQQSATQSGRRQPSRSVRDLEGVLSQDLRGGGGTGATGDC